MKDRTKETLFEKLIDVAVVIIGILIALSIDSYVETKKQEKQWKSFAYQFYRQAQDEAEDIQGAIEFYKERMATTGDMIMKLRSPEKKIAGLDEYLNSLGSLQVFFPDKDLYQAFLGMGNQYLLRDAVKLKALGEFYSFEELAMTNFRVFSDHFIVDYKKALTSYYNDLENGKDGKKDLVSVLISYSHHMKFTHESYLKHEEKRKKLIEILEPVVP